MTMMRHAIERTAVMLAVVWCAAVTSLHAEVIDRILAVVGREPIMLSDAIAAIQLGFVQPPPSGTDPVRGALDALIARQLELGEANRYQPPEPAPADIDMKLQAVRTRAGSPAALAAILTQTGLSDEQLRLRVRDDLRIDAFLAQRFGGSRQPTEPEMQDYYRAHTAEFTTASGLRPFTDVRETVRSQVMAAQRATLVSDWLDSLRRRTEVADLYVAAK